MNNIIETNNLSVRYQQKLALDQVTVAIPPNVRMAIIGANGAGKSTFLKSVMNLIPFQGKFKVLDSDIDAVRQRIAYVPQTSEVNWQFPTTVYDVVSMGILPFSYRFRSISKAQSRKIEQALDAMELMDLSNRQINQLSGGQKKRVFIARSLVQDADLYLLDEPLAGVDVKSEHLIMDQLRSFQKNGKTTLSVHHDLSTLSEYFDYVMLLKTSLVAIGPLEDVLTPENIRETFGHLPMSMA